MAIDQGLIGPKDAKPIGCANDCDDAMRFKDLREFIALLEDKGELRRVTAPVSCELEITELADRAAVAAGLDVSGPTADARRGPDRPSGP